jgi:transcriptional regulator with XRE-family HTH domain
MTETIPTKKLNGLLPGRCISHTNPGDKAMFDWKVAGHRPRVTRICLGISEADAAKAFGVTLRTYRKYEAGNPQRGAFPLVNFAEAYDVSLDWLIEGEGHGLRTHLKKNSGRKVAILPVISPQRRAWLGNTFSPKVPARGLS